MALVKNYKMGLRTFYKSFQAYTKANAGQNHSSRRALLIDGSTKLFIHKNAQIVNNGYFMLGIPKGFFPSDKPSQLALSEGSQLVINGNVRAGRGVIIGVGNNARLELGRNVCINSNTTIISTKRVTIGDDTGISWDVEIIDSDFHGVTANGTVIASPITIGSHVFVGRRAMIMKGVTIGDGSVIAAGAVVTKDVPENCLAAGVPARVVKENINWDPKAQAP